MQLFCCKIPLSDNVGRDYLKMKMWVPECFGLKTFRILQRKFVSLFLIFILSLTLVGATKRPPAIKVPIFGFHDIVDAVNPDENPPNRPQFDNDYSKQNLYSFFNYLVAQNYWFLSTQDLYTYFIKKSQPIPTEYLNRKPVMITFDDGYYSIHTNVLPILKDLEKNHSKIAKIVLFVNPNTLGVNVEGYLPHITCYDLREGYKRGFYDIQSHTFSHKVLTQLGSNDLNTELEQAKTELRQCTYDLDRNKWVAAHMAYPYGWVNKKVEKYLPKYHLTGYLYDGIISRPNRLRNPYRISRVRVNRFTTPRQLIKIAEQATRINQSNIDNI